MSCTRSRRVAPSGWRERGTLVHELVDVHYSAFGAVGGPGPDQQPGMALPARVAIEEAMVQHRCGIDCDSLDDPPLDARAARDVGHMCRVRDIFSHTTHVCQMCCALSQNVCIGS